MVPSERSIKAHRATAGLTSRDVLRNSYVHNHMSDVRHGASPDVDVLDSRTCRGSFRGTVLR